MCSHDPISAALQKLTASHSKCCHGKRPLITGSLILSLFKINAVWICSSQKTTKLRQMNLKYLRKTLRLPGERMNFYIWRVLSRSDQCSLSPARSPPHFQSTAQKQLIQYSLQPTEAVSNLSQKVQNHRQQDDPKTRNEMYKQWSIVHRRAESKSNPHPAVCFLSLQPDPTPTRRPSGPLHTNMTSATSC